jgi:hypothetical protein
MKAWAKQQLCTKKHTSTIKKRIGNGKKVMENKSTKVSKVTFPMRKEPVLGCSHVFAHFTHCNLGCNTLPKFFTLHGENQSQQYKCVHDLLSTTQNIKPSPLCWIAVTSWPDYLVTSMTIHWLPSAPNGMGLGFRVIICQNSGKILHRISHPVFLSWVSVTFPQAIRKTQSWYRLAL